MSSGSELVRDRGLAPVAAGLDLLLVAVFVVVGRSSHDEGITLAGWGETAWPFLLGLALGWVLVVLTLGRLPVTLALGVPVWLSTVFGGMALRDMADQGTALPFVVVATIFLGSGLLGWRAVAGWLRRRRPAPEPRGRQAVRRDVEPVEDPLGTRSLSTERDDQPGRGVLPPEQRARYRLPATDTDADVDALTAADGEVDD